MKYPIVIPSRGRSDRVDTIDNLPTAFHKCVWLFVLDDEYLAYERLNKSRWDGQVNIRVCSYSTDTISEKREKMARYMAEIAEYFWMMDDDLKFFQRRNEWIGDTRLEILSALDESGFENMFEAFEGMVKVEPDRFCSLGISMRQGNNNLKAEGDHNTRLIRCGLYRTEAFLNAHHNRLRYMGDFDVMIQMLKMGYDNFVTSQYSQDHVGTNAKGGCSSARDEQTMEDAANGLQALHPDCVFTKQKVNKGGKLAVRTDVTIYWKKARKNGF